MYISHPIEHSVCFVGSYLHISVGFWCCRPMTKGNARSLDKWDGDKYRLPRFSFSTVKTLTGEWSTTKDNMKRYFILPLLAALVINLASCEKDDPVTPDTPQKPDVENPENPEKPDEPDTPAPGENEDKSLDVTINPDGTTSTGVPFKWEPDSKTTFYLNHVKYEIVDTHLEAVGVDEYELKLSLGGKVKLCRSVTIDGNNYILRVIGDNSFRSSSLSNPDLIFIDIPDTVTEIGSHAFYECTNLVDVKLPNGLTIIGSYAFDRCSSLTSISIPSSVTTIGAYSFSGNGITKIILNDSKINLLLEENALYAPNLEEIYIGRDIKPLGSGPFGYFDNDTMEKITIGGDATIINNIYYNLKKLETVIVEEGILEIKRYAFHSSHCNNMYLPKSATQIAEGVFYYTSIENLYVKWTDETLINSFDPDIFKNADIKSLYVPKGCKEIYANCEWLKAANIGNIYEMEE